MSRSRSKKSKTSQTPLFIQKLIDMLEDPSINQIICWTTTNDSFHIKSISQFTQTVLPRFFKHNNFSSFIRQLNMYGFRKIRHDDGQNVYQNDSFKRGNRTLLKNIKRKVNLQKQDRIALYAQDNHSNNNLSRQIQEMKTKQKDLQQICRHLLVQNHKLIEENNNLMKKMKDDERKKERKIQKLLIAMILANQNKQPAIALGQSGDLMLGQEPHNNNNNIGNMLSLMTGQNSTDLNLLNEKNQETPLQVLTSALSRNKSMKQFKQMLESYYNVGPQEKSENSTNSSNQMRMTRNRVSNGVFGLGQGVNNLKFNGGHEKSVDHDMLRDEDSGFNLGQDSSEINHHHHFTYPHHNNGNHQNEQDMMRPINEDEDGFISINDFMNLDEEKPFIEPHENINLQDSN